MYVLEYGSNEGFILLSVSEYAVVRPYDGG